MEFTSATARLRYDDIVAVVNDTVVALDFDGTLAPIVGDPAKAHIHDDAPDLLVELAEVVRAIAVITGRPARQALSLGGLDEVGVRMGETGRELFLFGQYGNERWSSTKRRIISPRPPHGLSSYLRELPGILRRADALEAYVEEKGLAVAVHTRRLPDSEAAFDRLLPLLRDAAARNDLMIEPGRLVAEVRATGMHKGIAVHSLVDELGAKGFVFAGDDLGDLEAFAAVAELRDAGLATLLVCSASPDAEGPEELLDLADVVVEGPDGVLDLLRQLRADAR
ncbi:trehalose-phosphatase [Nocardioides sp. InS609-2]|uniref:trehalose-phosphatase n=1 Tax=Nocardioides sp. InS609-2 TaxID=2760705 RepID=UPI0020C00142|nr:trehalose-phosphatase [Nocardioides sp. InS609-2]